MGESAIFVEVIRIETTFCIMEMLIFIGDKFTSGHNLNSKFHLIIISVIFLALMIDFQTSNDLTLILAAMELNTAEHEFNAIQLAKTVCSSFHKSLSHYKTTFLDKILSNYGNKANNTVNT